MGMRVVQCWDDGVTADVPLVDILRRHGARATFNLNAGLHDAPRAHDWVYEGTQVSRLGWEDMRALYEGSRSRTTA
jgi:peptidoglycan-N-acetylglucosamine deacetylase